MVELIGVFSTCFTPINHSKYKHFKQKVFSEDSVGKETIY